jgi:hypothetical protein
VAAAREGVAYDDVWMHARRPTRRTILRRSRNWSDRAQVVLSIPLWEDSIATDRREAFLSSVGSEMQHPAAPFCCLSAASSISR